VVTATNLDEVFLMAVRALVAVGAAFFAEARFAVFANEVVLLIKSTSSKAASREHGGDSFMSRSDPKNEFTF